MEIVFLLAWKYFSLLSTNKGIFKTILLRNNGHILKCTCAHICQIKGSVLPSISFSYFIKSLVITIVLQKRLSLWPWDYLFSLIACYLVVSFIFLVLALSVHDCRSSSWALTWIYSLFHFQPCHFFCLPNIPTSSTCWTSFWFFPSALTHCCWVTLSELHLWLHLLPSWHLKVTPRRSQNKPFTTISQLNHPVLLPPLLFTYFGTAIQPFTTGVPSEN